MCHKTNSRRYQTQFSRKIINPPYYDRREPTSRLHIKHDY